MRRPMRRNRETMSTPELPPQSSAPGLISLHDAAADGYLRRLRAALRAARLSRAFPDGRRIGEELRVMDSECHRGTVDVLRVDPRAGLPAYVEWARTRADRELAPKLLSDLGDPRRLEEKAARSSAAIHHRQLAKARYYSELLEGELLALSELSIALRRVEPERSTAWFVVVFDKLEVSGLFVRYTIELSQCASAWTRPIVALSDDEARQTDELKAIVSRFGALDAELAFVQLAACEGIEVQRVAKCSIGPVLVPEAASEHQLAPLLKGAEAIVAMFPSDIAAYDLAHDGNNDPLDTTLGATLSDEARAEYLSARKRYGYKVFKDRKFVTDAASKAAVAEFCRQAGTRNVIYTLR